MTSRADSHDLDKLRRWRKDLDDTSAGAPPVFAVFLVDGEDRTAHNVFRAFRTSFEESNLGFAHLVIFGQHGVSDTAVKLRQKFGVEADASPQLVLFSGEGSRPRLVSLPPGEGDVPDSGAYAGWRDALEGAMEVVTTGLPTVNGPLDTLKHICEELLMQE